MTKIKVQLKGDHPHAGELAYFVVDKGIVTIDEFGMVELFLTNCQHGQSGCYASRKDFNLCGDSFATAVRANRKQRKQRA